ncbi:MAG: type pilus assembly protein PilB [Candidatus Sumerlaeota bacterium]|nr:type pilus assembly protein PilB [Candidatus Sumerlaeota bacterium]
MASAMERRLGEMLVSDGVVSAEDLEKVLKEQEATDGSLGRILVDMGLASEWEMAAALGKQLNVPFITLSHYDIDRMVLEAIPVNIVKKYKIVPVDKTGDTLTIALSDPSNIFLLDEIKILTKSQIIPVISFESDITEAIRRYYGNQADGGNFDEMLKEISDDDFRSIQEELESEQLDYLSGEEEENAEEEDAEVNDAPVIQLVNQMVMDAIKAGASDIHIEPFEKVVRLRYRIDGVLHEFSPPPKKFQNAICSRVKILSELDISEKRLPQDGRFRIKMKNRAIDFRVSTCPVVHGEKIVIRILDQGNLMLDMSELGFDPEELDKIETAINMPWGMALITGPTGSGKSTTLYSALSSINDPTKNISTIEDPVEYNLKGVNQVQARPDIGLTFSRGLKAFLRQDPDIIMIGEIRDLETGEIAIKAALTGHLVLSTIHTNDAPSTPQRMVNMGIEAFLVSASLVLIEAQRLVRRVCKNCKREYDPDPELLKALGIRDKDVKFSKGGGCEACRNTGKKGRVGLYEVLAVSDVLRDAITAEMPVNRLKMLAIKEGMRTLRMAGVRKCIQGVAAIEDVLGATMADELDEDDLAGITKGAEEEHTPVLDDDLELPTNAESVAGHVS